MSLTISPDWIEDLEALGPGADYRTAFGSVGKPRPDTSTVEAFFERAKLHRETQAPQERRLHPKVPCRAAFLSDFHLGTSSSCAVNLSRFLDHIEPDYLYLLGDVVDCWRMGGMDLFKIYQQSPAQTDVLQKLLRLQREGVRMVYVPGNHDGWFRDRLTAEAPTNGLAIMFEATHETLDGRRILVMHGDSFDEIVRGYRWLAWLGTRAYEKLAVFSAKIDKWRSNRSINHMFKTLGLEESWSLAVALRQASDKATFGASYEKAALAYLGAKNLEIAIWNEMHPMERPLPFYDEIMCGHTHIPMRKTLPSVQKTRPKLKMPSELVISNTGCWVGKPSFDATDIHTEEKIEPGSPACTAILEDPNGRLQHVQWIPEIGIVPIEPQKDGFFVSPSQKEARAKRGLGSLAAA